MAPVDIQQKGNNLIKQEQGPLSDKQDSKIPVKERTSSFLLHLA